MSDPLNIFGRNVALVICVPLVYLYFIRRHVMLDCPIIGAAKFDDTITPLWKLIFSLCNWRVILERILLDSGNILLPPNFIHWFYYTLLIPTWISYYTGGCKMVVLILLFLLHFLLVFWKKSLPLLSSLPFILSLSLFSITIDSWIFFLNRCWDLVLSLFYCWGFIF